MIRVKPLASSADVALVTAYRFGQVEVHVEPLGRGRWSRVVLVDDAVVYDLPGPAFPDAAAEAASSALLTLIMRLASSAPMHASVQAQLAGREDELVALRRALQRDPEQVHIPD